MLRRYVSDGGAIDRYQPQMDVGFGVEEFPPPLVANLFLQRVADITAFVCADRGTVCEDEPVADTILLPHGAKQIVILDLHADEVLRF